MLQQLLTCRAHRRGDRLDRSSIPCTSALARKRRPIIKIATCREGPIADKQPGRRRYERIAELHPPPAASDDVRRLTALALARILMLRRHVIVERRLNETQQP